MADLDPHRQMARQAPTAQTIVIPRLELPELPGEVNKRFPSLLKWRTDTNAAFEKWRRDTSVALGLNL